MDIVEKSEEMEIVFVTKNQDKLDEARAILGQYNINVKKSEDVRIEEIQTENLQELIKHKAVKAYDKIRKPLIVEHTGLYIEYLNGLPGGLTDIFWEKLKPAENLCNLFKSIPNKKTCAKTAIGYCDGKTVKVFEGELNGTISETARVAKDKKEFAWDPIFVPDFIPNPDAENALITNTKQSTFAELSVQDKNKFSMRRRAFDEFAKYFIGVHKERTNLNSNESECSIENKHFRDLAEAIAKDNVILFVGAGISKSANLPKWSELIDNMSDELGYDKEIFKILGDSLTLAEYYDENKKKSKDSDEKDKEYAAARFVIDKIKINTEMKKHEHTIYENDIYKLILDLDFPIIYTTNYDHLLEYAYKGAKENKNGKDYIPIVNVKDIKNIEKNQTQIVKFHGDIKYPSSIVLTESSYFKRLDFEHPLDIKFRSDILGKSILFIGYTLGDINIKYLIHNLNRLWGSVSSHSTQSGSADDKDNIQPNSYILLSPNAVQQEVLRSRNIIPLISGKDSWKEAYIDFLQNLNDEVQKIRAAKKQSPTS